MIIASGLPIMTGFTRVAASIRAKREPAPGRRPRDGSFPAGPGPGHRPGAPGHGPGGEFHRQEESGKRIHI